MTARLSQLRYLQEFADRPTSATYSLFRKHGLDPNADVTSEENCDNYEAKARLTASTEQKNVLLPCELPPVNTYVWPPLEWSSDQKRVRHCGLRSCRFLHQLHLPLRTVLVILLSSVFTTINPVSNCTGLGAVMALRFDSRLLVVDHPRQCCAV